MIIVMENKIENIKDDDYSGERKRDDPV